MPYQGYNFVLLDMFNKCELYLLKCYFATKHSNGIIMYVSLNLHGTTIDKNNEILSERFLYLVYEKYIYNNSKPFFFSTTVIQFC